MKPGEFDDLVRQKFDQNDFEYNPRNWDKLTEELDGQKKKRGLLFWWMPLMGVAATVAMAFGVSKVMRQGSGVGNGNTGRGQIAMVQKHTAAPTPQEAITEADAIPAQDAHATGIADAASSFNNNNKKSKKIAVAGNKEDNDGAVVIDIETALGGSKSKAVAAVTGIVKPFAIENDLNKKKKKVIVVTQGYYTFNDEEVKKKDPKVAIILSGGVNYSNQGNGYMVGATARRMINDKVYVESDIAFIGTSNTQKTQYLDKSGVGTGSAGASSMNGSGLGAKNSGKNTDEGGKITDGLSNPGVLKTQDQAYNLYYAQVTPSIGYKLMKKLSIGVGPDFQQMLVDNRPEVSTVDRGNLKVAPVFDIGFMGKTEYAIAKNVKAAVYYREGINNVITPTNKYIDRNYLQFQIKCTILNR